MTYLAQISFGFLFREWSFHIEEVIFPSGLDICKIFSSGKVKSFYFKGLISECYFSNRIGLVIIL